MNRHQRPLTVTDAARLLNDDAKDQIRVLDRAMGGAILGTAAIAGPAVLPAFAVKNELINMSRSLLERLLPLAMKKGQRSRIEMLGSAHAILIFSSYWAALEESLDRKLESLGLTRDDQLRLTNPQDYQWPSQVLSGIMRGGVTPIGPRISRSEFQASLLSYYTELGEPVLRLVKALAIWDSLDETRRGEFRTSLARGIPARAANIYSAEFVNLAIQAPDFFVWVMLNDADAAQSMLGRLNAETRMLMERVSALADGTARGFDELTDLMHHLGTKSDLTGSKLAQALHIRYTNRVERPSIEIPPGGDLLDVRLPILGEAYIPPVIRTALMDETARPADERWWEDRSRRDDFLGLVMSLLSSQDGWRTPTLILGHPGSGKSVLSKMLGVLPFPSCVPCIVELRDIAVPWDADIRRQVDESIKAQTGLDGSWADLAEAHPESLLVLVLDGFDELLQATGVSRSDYLERVQQFQEIEADQGRPVTVIVTSRTLVAHRARIPRGSLLIKLEPFAEPQVGRWLDQWNRLNIGPGDVLEDRGPLSLEAIRPHLELAEQPILLLMLALYDVAAEDFRRSGHDLRRAHLYEDLLRQYVLREVFRAQPNLERTEMEREVEGELDRLSVVGLAMFTRGQQFISEGDLGRDLAGLLPVGDLTSPDAADGDPDTRAKQLLGRFFFVHEARAAVVGDKREILRTYEFLHATFQEYLVARVICKAHRAAADTSPVERVPLFPSQPDLEPDTTWLKQVLSFRPLSANPQIPAFITEIIEQGVRARPPSPRVLIDSMRESLSLDYVPSDRYAPRKLTGTQRLGRYQMNLFLLWRAMTGGPLSTADVLSDLDGHISDWRLVPLFWRSQVTGVEWSEFIAHLIQEPLRVSSSAAPLISPAVEMITDDQVRTPAGSWAGSASGLAEVLRKESELSGHPREEVVTRVVEQLSQWLGPSVTGYWATDPSLAKFMPELDESGLAPPMTAAEALLYLQLAPTVTEVPVSELRSLHRICAFSARKLTTEAQEYDRNYRSQYLLLLLRDAELFRPQQLAQLLASACASRNVDESPVPDSSAEASAAEYSHSRSYLATAVRVAIKGSALSVDASDALSKFLSLKLDGIGRSDYPIGDSDLVLEILVSAQRYADSFRAGRLNRVGYEDLLERLDLPVIAQSQPLLVADAIREARLAKSSTWAARKGMGAITGLAARAPGSLTVEDWAFVFANNVAVDEDSDPPKTLSVGLRQWVDRSKLSHNEVLHRARRAMRALGVDDKGVELLISKLLKILPPE